MTMSMLLILVGVVLAAFGIWLMVRIIARKEKWAKRTAAGLVAGIPILYLLGFGAGCRAIAVPLGGTVKMSSQMKIYWPLGALAANRDSSAGAVVRWYMRLWTPPKGCVLIQTDMRGHRLAAIFPDEST